MEPVRTCIACRIRGEKSSLLRVVAANGVVVADLSVTRPGRGAWIHPTVACADTAVRRRSFGRALRVTTPLATDALLALLAERNAESQPGFPEEQAD